MCRGGAWLYYLRKEGYFAVVYAGLSHFAVVYAGLSHFAVVYAGLSHFAVVYAGLSTSLCFCFFVSLRLLTAEPGINPLKNKRQRERERERGGKE